MKLLKVETSKKYKRPARGEAVCKAVKSNPPIIRHVMAVTPEDEIALYGENVVELKAKDVPFMDKTGTFTGSKTKDTDWYLGRKIVKQQLPPAKVLKIKKTLYNRVAIATLFLVARRYYYYKRKSKTKQRKQ